MVETVGAELREKIENPLKFQYVCGGAGAPQSNIHGFYSSILIELCNAIISVSDKLGDRYAAVVKQAHLINGASAKLGK